MAEEPQSSQSRRQTLVRFSTIVALVIAVAAVVSVLRVYSPSPARPLAGPGQSGAIGTGGSEPEQARAEAPPPLPSTGAAALLGQRITLRTTRGPVAGAVAFWAEHDGYRLLVVTNRDRRSGEDRQRSLPAQHAIHAFEPGQPVVVSGVIERLPPAEARYSWNLTSTDAATVAEEGVYLRADTITPEGAESH